MSHLLFPVTLSLRNHLQKSFSQLHFRYLVYSQNLNQCDIFLVNSIPHISLSNTTLISPFVFNMFTKHSMPADVSAPTRQMICRRICVCFGLGHISESTVPACIEGPDFLLRFVKGCITESGTRTWKPLTSRGYWRKKDKENSKIPNSQSPLSTESHSFAKPFSTWYVSLCSVKLTLCLH